MKPSTVVSICVIVGATLMACRPTTSPTEVQPNPTAEYECEAMPATWRGLVPGSSTKSEVEQILGKPEHTTSVPSPYNLAKIYEYPPYVTGIVEKLGNRVAVGADARVAWIDSWVANADGRFHTIAEFVHTYGSTLDRVYLNGAGDVAGPEEVYVWAACGVALTTVPTEYYQDAFNANPSLIPPSVPTNLELTLIYPLADYDSRKPQMQLDDLVLRAFFFPATNYAYFRTAYESNIVRRQTKWDT